MTETKDIIIAAKCAPREDVLSDIKGAGLKAVELYLSKEILNDIDKIISVCRCFPFTYSVHAPNDGYEPDRLIRLAKALNAGLVVFHDIYWEDEWGEIIKSFKDTGIVVCIENTHSVHEPLRFMRRYGLGRCLDIEHLIMQCAGIYEEEFITAVRQASHIHLTGYVYGSQLWHTHIHHSPEHTLYLLDLLKKAGYSGFVVSEAKASLQTYEEFKRLNGFFKTWNATAGQLEKRCF